MKNNTVYQFKISLCKIEPTIWRRIQVPEKYSFWDLHVAIQDVMGWLDYHLHAFRFRPKHKKNKIEIGIPVDDFGTDAVIAGWEVPVRTYFTEPGQIIPYLYDFGDSWNHEILFEGILLKTKGEKYPKCLDGERACPPEDCGGISGYYRFISVLKGPKNNEYKEYVSWLKGHAINYFPYDPDAFTPNNVHFDDPNQRWKKAFS
jgi:hypothetical protein